MGKPLSLLIKRPYAGPNKAWTLRLAYGDALPSALRMQSEDLAEFILLETTNADAPLLAASNGYLSTRFPADYGVENESPLTPDMSQAEPEAILVYLNPRPHLDNYPGFAARIEQLASEFAYVLPPDGVIDALHKPLSGLLHAFLYLNVNAQSMKTALGPALDTTTVPPAATLLEREQRWRLFLTGQLDIEVSAGQEIGRAGTTLIPPLAGGIGQAGFAVLARNGTLDPALFYDWMRDFVIDESEVGDWLDLVPKRWPLLGPGTGLAEAMERTKAVIFPYTVLQQFAKDHSLTPSQWREVGANQKLLYQQRLRMRTKQGSAGESAPPFEFNDLDWKNLFQLEAVTEYYANFNEPWLNPVASTDSTYRNVDLLPLQGGAAVVTGTQVTLDSNPDFERIWPARDTIYLEADKGRASRTYRITAVDASSNQVTLDTAPALNGAASSAWRIVGRPVLVLIDPFGPRIQGTNAVLNATGTNQIRLDVDQTLFDKINKDNFDTIYFYDDTTSQSFRPRTYRIIDTGQDTTGNLWVETNETPTFPNGSSAWGIPAGIGGVLPPLQYNLGDARADCPANNSSCGSGQGLDHYDGVILVVNDGAIVGRFRWTSYTSRNYDAGSQNLSSIRGNALYHIASYRSNNDFINFAFAVVDGGAVVKTNTSWLFLPVDTNSAGPYDGVRENRFYFGNTITADTAGPGTNPATGGNGKTEIRMHYGNRQSNKGTGSAGCQVSPEYFNLRRRLIELYEDERRKLNLADDGVVAQIRQAVTLDDSRTLHGSLTNSADWNGKVAGFLWVIRPEERPLG
ncbi:MAG: hypothetical protein H3C34_20785 [Caldilineaceae bacterium]|nr:hypothetical protein [Caldilineaceae bacterium]